MNFNHELIAIARTRLARGKPNSQFFFNRNTLAELWYMAGWTNRESRRTRAKVLTTKQLQILLTRIDARLVEAAIQRLS